MAGETTAIIRHHGEVTGEEIVDRHGLMHDDLGRLELIPEPVQDVVPPFARLLLVQWNDDKLDSVYGLTDELTVAFQVCRLCDRTACRGSGGGCPLHHTVGHD